jgi:hypothetical protein
MLICSSPYVLQVISSMRVLRDSVTVTSCMPGLLCDGLVIWSQLVYPLLCLVLTFLLAFDRTLDSLPCFAQNEAR